MNKEQGLWANILFIAAILGVFLFIMALMAIINKNDVKFVIYMVFYFFDLLIAMIGLFAYQFHGLIDGYSLKKAAYISAIRKEKVIEQSDKA